MISQNISKQPRIQTVINSKGDTLIQMTLADAKFILTDLLDKQVMDSLITSYQLNDSLQGVTIDLQLEKIRVLVEKNDNQLSINNNNQLIINNKDAEILLLNDIIKKQKRAILKQKILKVVGFSAAIILPITVLLLTH